MRAALLKYYNTRDTECTDKALHMHMRDSAMRWTDPLAGVFYSMVLNLCPISTAVDYGIETCWQWCQVSPLWRYVFNHSLFIS